MSANASILHPVRFRIYLQLRSSGDMTTRQLQERLDDVPIATLYRHITRLLKDGAIEIVRERQIRGASERTYRAVEEQRANPQEEDLQALSAEDYELLFSVFIAKVADDFRASLRSEQEEHVNVSGRMPGFGVSDFWATPEELSAFIEEYRAGLLRLSAHAPGEGRERYSLALVTLRRPEGRAE